MLVACENYFMHALLAVFFDMKAGEFVSIKTVLIVDDNEVDRFLHEAILHRAFPDIDVLQAFDGSHALEILENAKPDVIFLDINMPNMDGIEFLSAYHARESAEVPPIYMLTSLYQDCDILEVAKYDAVKECLEKPLTPDMLADIMKP